jgi:hypothetical protein
MALSAMTRGGAHFVPRPTGSLPAVAFSRTDELAGATEYVTSAIILAPIDRKSVESLPRYRVPPCQLGQ